MSRPPAPKIDHPFVFSVSQVENFLRCERKWAFNKIDRIEEPSTLAQELGKEVHEQHENYLRFGTPYDLGADAGQIAFSGHKHLPLPGTPGMRIEEWFVFRFGVAVYRGLKDIEILQTGRIPRVIDHKSTASFRWQKTEEELKTDIQACIYAADAMEKSGSAVVDCKWIYHRTKGARRSAVTEVSLRDTDVLPVLEKVDEAAKQMITVLKTVSNGMEATPNFTSCSLFGGCHFRGIKCDVRPRNVLVSLMRQKMEEENRGTQDFLQKLRDRKSSNGAADAPSKTQSINPEEAKQAAVVPAPPSPKKIGKDWIQASWNPETKRWEWPIESMDAEEEQTASGKKFRESAEKEQKSGVSALARFKAKKDRQEPEPEPEKATPARKTVAIGKLPTEAETRTKTLQAWDVLLDTLADLVAAKLRDRM